MNKTVLVASDEMRLCNVLKAIKDLEQIFRVCDENVTGEGEHSGIGILSPTKKMRSLHRKFLIKPSLQQQQIGFYSPIPKACQNKTS